jgi:hypothetical protein
MTLYPALIFIFLTVVIPSLLIWNNEGNFSFNFFFTYTIILWSSLRLSYTALEGRRRYTLLFFYVFVYVFLGVQPASSVWSQFWPHDEFSFSDELISFIIFLVLAGVIGFEIGYFRLKDMFKGQPMGVKYTEPPVRLPSISIPKLWIGSIVSTALVMLAMMRYGPNIFLALRDGGFSLGEFQGPDSSQAENMLVIFGLRGLAAALLFITLYTWRHKNVLLTNKRFCSIKALLSYLLFLNLILSNPLNAPRLWSGGVILTGILIIMRWNGTKSFLNWATNTSLAFLLLFSGTDPRRIFGQQIMRGEEITFANTAREVGVAIRGLPRDLNFDAFQMIGYTIDYTAKFGYSWGNQILLPAFFWVPRSIWKSKPIGTPDMVAENANFGSINVSSPLWVEGFINFGIPGLILFLYLFGRTARLADESLAHKDIRLPFSTIISSFFAANTFILLRGDLTSGTMYLQMVAGITFILLFLVRTKWVS